jgi:PAS domain S-box-containing protein
MADRRTASEGRGPAPPRDSTDPEPRLAAGTPSDTATRIAALEAASEHLRLAMRAARLCVFDHDIAARTLHWTDECRALFGVAGDEPLSNAQFMAAIHPDDRARVVQAIDRALHEYAEYSVEFRIVRPDGRTRWVSAVGDCVYDDLGRAQRFLGVMLDVTSRKRAEAALYASEERFRRLAESIEEAFWIFDPAAARFVYLSPGHARLYGLDPERAYGDPGAMLAAAHPDDRAFAEAADAARRGGRAFDVEFRIATPRGVRWIRERGLAVRGPRSAADSMVGFTRDVTARKEFDAHVADAVMRLRGLVDRTVGPAGAVEGRLAEELARLADELGALVRPDAA